jgi:hypothetical protein
VVGVDAAGLLARRDVGAVVAHFRPGGITSADRERITADAVEICGSAAIPSLTLVSTPYGLACGDDDPLDLSPGAGLLTSSDGSVALVSALMTDDSTPVAEAAAAAIRAVVPPPGGDEIGLRAWGLPHPVIAATTPGPMADRPARSFRPQAARAYRFSYRAWRFS